MHVSSRYTYEVFVKQKVPPGRVALKVRGLDRPEPGGRSSPWDLEVTLLRGKVYKGRHDNNVRKRPLC